MRKIKKYIQYIFKYQRLRYLLFILFLILCFLFSSILQNERSTIFGIDISKWNGELESMPSEASYIIIRCGYTSNETFQPKIDPMFYEYVNQCIEQDIDYGVYYYSLASSEQKVMEEVDFVLQTIDGYDVPLGVFFDIEDASLLEYDYQILNNVAITFCEEIEKNGYLTGVYASYYWWNNVLDIDTIPYLKWMALYDSPNYELEDIYDIYQYTNTGRIEGYSCDFDFNSTKNKYW